METKPSITDPKVPSDCSLRNVGTSERLREICCCSISEKNTQTFFSPRSARKNPTKTLPTQELHISSAVKNEHAMHIQTCVTFHTELLLAPDGNKHFVTPDSNAENSAGVRSGAACASRRGCRALCRIPHPERTGPVRGAPHIAPGLGLRNRPRGTAVGNRA